MKKKYTTPQTEVVQVQTSCLLAASNPEGYQEEIFDDYVEDENEIL